MRIQKLKKILKRDNRFPYLISSLTNIYYLTGFKGSYACLIIDKDASYFISDSRYEEYAKSVLPKSVNFVLQKKDLNLSLREIIGGAGRKRLFLEEHSMMLSNYNSIIKGLKGIKVLPGGDTVNQLRIFKDDGEVPILRQAAEITDSCFSMLLGMIKPGISEWDIAVEIEHFYRVNGCTKTSFDPIVASGPGSSMPHYAVSPEKKVRAGEAVLIDMGCVYNGYNSDLTRTIFTGSIDNRFREIYGIVREAQEKAVSMVRPGVKTGRLDAVARDLIARSGYGDAFGHSLGHGVGLDVHELPAVKSGGDFILRKNAVITIEPGIYIPDFGGVRIEDTVLVTPVGCEVLTKSTKEIIII
jgi:Xaa-Pro aminopeptidase